MALLLLYAGSSLAHIGDPVAIYELSDVDLEAIDLYDGSVVDWIDLLGPSSLSAVDFAGDHELGRYDPSDLEFRLWLGWNSTYGRVYCAVERADDHYWNLAGEGVSQGRAWDFIGQDSSVLFAVDGDHSGGVFFYSSAVPNYQELTNRQAQNYVVISESPDNGGLMELLPNGLDYPRRWFTEQPYAAAGGRRFGEAPTISVVEFFVTAFDALDWRSPEESVRSGLATGQVIGVKIQVFDVDGARDPFGLFMWPDTSNRIWAVDAGTFGDGLLVGRQASGGPADAGARSWARIKAGLRDGAESRSSGGSARTIGR